MENTSNKNVVVRKNKLSPQKIVTEPSSTIVTKKKTNNVKLAQKPSSAVSGVGTKLTVHQQRQIEQIAKNKKRTFFAFGFIAFVVLFFAFGLVARFIFGPNSPITKIAEDNILAVINVVHLVDNYIDVIVKSLSTIFLSITIIVLLLLIMKVVGSGSNRRKTIARLMASFVKYIGALVMVMIVLATMGVDAGTLLASVGILGIVIGLGAQSLISDILAGLFIVFENCFQVGDIVTFNTFRGEVVDIGLRTTRMKDILGDVMVVNNSELRIYINQSQHSSFAVCDITIEYGENIEKVEKIIQSNIQEIANKLKTITEGPMYRGVAGFSERGVVLKIVARCDEENKIQLNRDLAREMKLLFDKHKIKIAVPKLELKKS